LVSGVEFLPSRARWLALAVADFWNSRIEEWTVARDSAVGRGHGIAAHYVRLAPADVVADRFALNAAVPIKNRADRAAPPACEQISADFLQLVRFGLRAPSDPIVRDSLKLVDALLRYDGPTGPAFRRYTGDGYGEHPDGSPYDGTGQGRPWPLLTGERGHYELEAGHDALPWLEAMASMTGPGGMIPEQIWDGEPLEHPLLLPGRPSGSAMPLAWAHAEFLKLVVSRHLRRVADCPAALPRRYNGRRPRKARTIWSPAAPVTRLEPGANLIALFPWPVQVRWACEGLGERSARAVSNPLGPWIAVLPTLDCPTGSTLRLSWNRLDGQESGEARLRVRAQEV
jgi:glucoamylase